MKKLILIAIALTLAHGPAAAQAPTVIEQVNVSARTVARQPRGKMTVLNLTRKNTVYRVAAGSNLSRIQVRTATKSTTVAEMLRLSPRKVTGALRVGLTSVISGQALNLAATSGQLNAHTCEGLMCTCTGDEDCNEMFRGDDCGVIAVCDERGCWCLRI